MSELTASNTLHALRVASAHAERFVARALEPYGVTAAQFELLQAIATIESSGGGCSELARRVAAPGPDITRMIDRLVAAGLVARLRDENDRRVVHAQLTEKARELLRDATPAVSQAESEMFGSLDIGEREALTTLLLGVRRNCPG